MGAYILGVQWLPLILPPTPTLNALAFFSIDTSVSRISSYKKFSDHSLPQYSLSNFILSLAQLLWWVPRSWILINLCMRHLPAQSMCMVLKGRTMSSLISVSFQIHHFVLCAGLWSILAELVAKLLWDFRPVKGWTRRKRRKIKNWESCYNNPIVFHLNSQLILTEHVLHGNRILVRNGTITYIHKQVISSSINILMEIS